MRESSVYILAWWNFVYLIWVSRTSRTIAAIVALTKFLPDYLINYFSKMISIKCALCFLIVSVFIEQSMQDGAKDLILLGVKTHDGVWNLTCVGSKEARFDQIFFERHGNYPDLRSNWMVNLIVCSYILEPSLVINKNCTEGKGPLCEKLQTLGKIIEGNIFLCNIFSEWNYP